VAKVCQQGYGPLTVLDTSGADHHDQQQASRVDEDVVRVPPAVLVRIISVNPPFLWS
jgi:hypothetical protein